MDREITAGGPGPSRVEQAQHFMRLSRYEDAQQCLHGVLAQDPDHAGAHALLAICHFEQGDLDEALAESRQAIRLAPENAYCFYVLGWIQARRGKLDTSRRVLSDGLRLSPTEPDLHELKSDVHVGLNQLEAALESAEEGLTHNPTHLGCLNSRAVALLGLGRSEEALSTLEAALRLSPTHVTTRSNLGETLNALGRAEEAREHLREALRLDPMQKHTRKRFTQAMRSRSVPFRLLRPVLLKCDALTEDDPIGSRVAAGMALLVLAAGVVQYPAGRVWLVPLTIALVPILFCVLFARPLMNFLLRKDPLTQQALTWLERIGALCVPWVGVWAAGLGLTLLVVGSSPAVLLPVISAFGWVLLGIAHATRDELTPGSILRWAGLAGLIWAGIVAIQTAGVLASPKAISISHTLFLVSCVAGTAVLTKSAGS